jgi:aspartate aminotransferase-like enzyme
MQTNAPLIFKIADQESEFEQIHRLNYRTFVEEIPQHDPNSNQLLQDRFDHENTYVICLCDNQVRGMICVRGKRPFSLDEKLNNLDFHLPPGRTPCEIRLLSVEKNRRNGKIFLGLIQFLARYCKTQGYNLAVISGTVRQKKLYRHLGFVPFGPLVGTPAARFQPMYLTLETFEERATKLFQASATGSRPKILASLLPGPVSIAPEVRRDFLRPPISHRSESFIAEFQQTKRLLCSLVRSRYVEILVGSGTLANDAIAAQLSLLSGSGLILSNGEFGDRLIDHAGRFGLSFKVLQVDWGNVFDPDAIRRRIHENLKIEWLWAVHCETSTGILNNMAVLKEICAERGILLCMDCISSIGTVPVDFNGVYLASGVSGKGLGAFSGLSMVFYRHKIPPAPNALPRYLDLGLYAANKGVPFTVSSNLLYALRTALNRFESKKLFDQIRDLSLWIRSRLRDLGFQIVAAEEHGSPAVITIALPATTSSERVGRELEEAGYSLSYKSHYLLRRNWIQICLMGECSREKMVPLMDLLREIGHQGCAPTKGISAH